MPIEIRELVIRAQIDPCDSSLPTSRGPSGAVPGSSAALSNDDRADIIRTCVQEVLQILEDRQER